MENEKKVDSVQFQLQRRIAGDIGYSAVYE